MVRHYIQKDGNGGVSISMSMIALGSLVLLVIGSLATTVYGYGTLNTKVEDLREDSRIVIPRLETCETNYAVIQKELESINKELIRLNDNLEEHMENP